MRKDFAFGSDKDWIEGTWKKIKKERKAEERVAAISQEVKHHFVERTNDYARRASEVTSVFWDEKTQDFKKTCIRVIIESPDLTDEHKRFLEKYILTVEPMRIDKIAQSRDSVWGVVPRHFLFFRMGEKFDVGQCISRLHQRSGQSNLWNDFGRTAEVQGKVSKMGRSSAEWLERENGRVQSRSTGIF